MIRTLMNRVMDVRHQHMPRDKRCNKGPGSSDPGFSSVQRSSPVRRYDLPLPRGEDRGLQGGFMYLRRENIVLVLKEKTLSVIVLAKHGIPEANASSCSRI